MRIAQVAPLHESVPPKYYGGTERVVSYLTEELVAQGHDVTLFASGDSVTTARLVPGSRRALRLDPDCRDPLPHHVLLVERAARRATDFDVMHFHLDYIHFPLMRLQRVPHLTTVHGRLDLPDLGPLYREFRDAPLVSISDAQRAPLPWAGWETTVYHGLPRDLYRLNERSGDYFAFVGRISPEKRVDRAIEIARRTGIPLKIAAKVNQVERGYFDAVVRPWLGGSLVEFVGEIGEADKNEFLGDAQALLFPIDWPEPFGLVMIEAMACGTPTIAFRRGSVPEVMTDPRSGFIVDSVDAAVKAAARIPRLDRAGCRAAFEQRFTATRMAQDYLAAYERIIERGSWAASRVQV